MGDAWQVHILARPSYSPVIYRAIVREACPLVRNKVVAVFVDQTDPCDDLLYELDLVPG